MGLESRMRLDEPRQDLRWPGSNPDYASWTASVAGRWQHAARCATCGGLKAAHAAPVSGHGDRVRTKVRTRLADFLDARPAGTVLGNRDLELGGAEPGEFRGD